MKRFEKKFFICSLLIFSVIIFLSCTKRENKSLLQEAPQSQEIEIQNTAADNNIEKNETLSEKPAEKKVDIDLSKMSKDMVYAAVFQFMCESESYEGKVIRIEGTYTSFDDEQDSSKINYCIVTDALSCCWTGIEFELAPEYAELEEQLVEEKNIIVTGKFENYIRTVDGNEVDCFRLSNSSVVIKE